MGFRERLEIGKATERAVIFVPKLRSYRLHPLTDISNGMAPGLLEVRGERLALACVSPDFEAHRPGEHYGLEIKGKDHADPTGVSGEIEHGIGLRKFQDYLKWQEDTGMPVILLIDENRTGEVLAASLNKLQMGTWTDQRDGVQHSRPRVYFGEKMDRGGMAFFGRNQFLVFHQREAKDLPLLRTASVAPTLPMARSLSEV